MKYSREILEPKVLKVFNSQSHAVITTDMVNVHFTKLGIDSLDLVQTIVMIEKLFHIPIFDEECNKLTTINDYIKLIERKINKELYI